jgi:hypothetical protein
LYDAIAGDGSNPTFDGATGGDGSNGLSDGATPGDASNSGSDGGIAADGGGAMPPSAPETFLSGLEDLMGIVLDDTNLYWFSGNPMLIDVSGEIHSVPKTGGADTILLQSIGPLGASFIQRDGYLYYGTTVSDNNVIERVSITGTNRKAVANWIPNEGIYAVDDQSLYGLDPCYPEDPLCASKGDSVVQVPRDGSSGGAILVQNSPGARVFGADGTYIYFSDVTDPDHASIMRMPRAGGTTEPIAQDQPQPYLPFLSADGYVYWVDACSDPNIPSNVMRVRAGAAPELLTTDTCPMGIQADGADVYWVGAVLPMGTYVHHLKIGSTVVQPIYSDTGGPDSFHAYAFDSTHLYFATTTTIYRVLR